MTAPTGSVLLTPFHCQPRTALIFGPGSAADVGQMARNLSGRRALLVTDPGLVAAGHADRVHQALLQAGLAVVRFDQVEENPTARCVEQCLQVARTGAVDLLVGLGGGSSIDTAKGCNFLLTNGGRIQDYQGVGQATQPMLPLIAIPTTAGTGSECQSFALLTDNATHQKMACGDPKAAPRVAVLDPCLTLSQPPQVTAFSGVDALAHALETSVTRKRNGLSLMHSTQAFKLVLSHLPRVLRQPTDLEARGAMLLGAALAGVAIENSMLGAAHAAANPLTAHYGLPHGLAVGMMLPAVVRFNAAEGVSQQAYADLSSMAGLPGSHHGSDHAVKALLVRLEAILNQAHLPRSLADCGVPPSAVPELASEAARQWTARFNPRILEANDFERLYQAAFQRRPDNQEPG